MEDNVRSLLEQDPLFREIITKYGFPFWVRREPGFESLCLIVLEQQVSLESAKACYLKLKALVHEFTPEAIVNLSAEAMRSCGVSRQKTAYLYGIAEAVLSGDLDFQSLVVKEDAEIRADLTRLKGVGNWTADIYLMFCNGSPDILPLGDIGVVASIKEIWKLDLLDDMSQYTERWSPYRTTATFLLWHYYLEKRGRKFPY